MKRILFFVGIFCICGCFSIFSQTSGARLSFDKEFLSKKVVPLRGNWELYTNKLITANNDGQYEVDTYILVPGEWNSTLKKINVPIHSSNTYRIVIDNLIPNAEYGFYIKDSPSNACEFYCNGEFVTAAGKVSLDLNRVIPKNKPVYAFMNANADGVIEFVIQVSNSVYRRGGVWDDVRFGTAANVYKEFTLLTGLHFFIMGAILILAFLYFLIFILDNSRKAEWIFSWMLFVIIIRIATAEFSLFGLYFSWWSFEMQYKLEFFTLWFMPLSFVLFYLQYVKDDKILALIARIIIMIIGFIGVLVTSLPVKFSNYLVDLMMFMGVISVGFIFVCSIIDMYHKRLRGVITFIDILIVMSGFLPDYLMIYRRELFPARFTPYAMLVFVLFQYICISIQQRKLYNKVETLVGELQKVNDASVKFVPQEFLRVLNVKDVVSDIKVGDHVDAEMTVIFAQMYFDEYEGCIQDIKENKTAILTSFLKDISPKIVANKGFISRFISGGFMAVFPDSSSDAIRCCQSIVGMLSNFNLARKTQKKSLLKIGIGVHYGKMMLGMIGEANRLDDIIISDAVNIASEIQSYAEKQKISIVVSQAAVRHADSDLFKYKSLGEIKIKGGNMSLQLSEICV